MIDDTGHYRQVIDKMYRFGEKKGMEYTFFTNYKNSFKHISPQFISIFAGKYRRETIRQSRLKNARDMFLFPLGILQSIRYILMKDIDIVFCKWWYVSLPVVIAAWICRRQIYVHDSDTTPGLTTKFASRFSSQNFSWFPDTLPDSIVVGQILSDALVHIPAELPFSIPDDKLVVLVAGWSLGAKKLYEGVLQAIQGDEKFLQDYVFVFVNGQNTIDKKLIPTQADHIIITGLITEQALMGWLYARADGGVVRGGTTTLAECKLFDLPLVIVPLPVTHDQVKNTQYYVEHYGDTYISQNDENFIHLLYKSLVSVKPKNITTTIPKIKNKIKKAKITILDRMLGQNLALKQKIS